VKTVFTPEYPFLYIIISTLGCDCGRATTQMDVPLTLAAHLRVSVKVR